MSMKKQQRALADLMAANGYTLKREAKHMVWGNAKGQTITTSKTPSDLHALKQVERDIRRQAAAA